MGAFDEYRAAEGVNWSSLSKILESPAAYKWNLDHPRPDTEAFALGRAVHALALEPSAFGEEFAVWTGGDRRGAEWQAFKKAAGDRVVFKPHEIERAQDMANAVRTHPLVTPYLTGGRFEVPLRWTDLTTGLKCKARVDWLQPRAKVLLELKTAVSIDARKFAAASFGYHYAGQLAHYAAGVEATYGWVPEKMVIVAVEKHAPYDVGVFVLDIEQRAYGSSLVAQALGRLRECLEVDEWPGRYTEEQELGLPPYAYGDDDDLNLDDME